MRVILLIATILISSVQAFAQYTPVTNYWNKDRGDNFLVTLSETSMATEHGYVVAYAEGYLSETQVANTTPRYLYFNAIRGDYFSTATAQGMLDAQNAGYTLIEIQGYIWTIKTSQNLVPLHLYYSPEREDNFTFSSPQGMGAVKNTPYRQARLKDMFYAICLSR